MPALSAGPQERGWWRCGYAVRFALRWHAGLWETGTVRSDAFFSFLHVYERSSRRQLGCA
jgi:hypothetical protein